MGDHKNDPAWPPRTNPLAPRPDPPSLPTKPARRVPHGTLDLVATVMLMKNENLTVAEIAAKLECHPRSLLNHERYPSFARELARIKASRQDYRPRGMRHDRRRNGSGIPDLRDPDDDES